ncbi:MAG TPA: ERF family protein [Xanthobacteraceae bacterium]
MNAIVEAAPSGGLLSFIERAARDENFDVSKFEALLRMQRELADQQALQAFNAAMARVEEEIGPVLRDRLNPAVNRKYATLEAMDAVARPVYSRHGFSVRFGCAPSPTPNWMRITCTVSHAAGYSEQNYLDSPVDLQQGARARSPVQAVGSTITYLRRYLLQMAFNIVLADDETDDDGEATRRDRQAERAYPPRDARDAINRDVPLESTPPRTRASFLDGLEVAMRDCGSLDEVNKLIAHPDTQRAMATFTNGHKGRLDGIIAAGIGAHAQVVHEEADGWPGPTPADFARERETAGT